MRLNLVDQYVTDLKGNQYHIVGDPRRRLKGVAKTRRYWRDKLQVDPDNVQYKSFYDNWNHLGEQIKLLVLKFKGIEDYEEV